MSEVPSGYFQVLGLPPYADVVMVRRAYARRLRELDPGADTAGFETLRAAYEAALAWCDQHPETSETDTLATESSTSGETSTPKDDFAEDLIRQLSADAATQPPASMDGLLSHALAALRMQYVDAPGELEDRLVDMLREGTIANRPALFDAADIHFHWTEIGRGQRDEPRREWVERVLAQRETWSGFDARQREKWMALITHAATQGIDHALARAWPEIARLHAAIPDWLSLHLPAATLSAWEAAFTAPHAATPRHRGNGQRRVWVSRSAWVIPSAACLAAAAFIYGLPDMSGLSMQRFGTQADTPATCMALHARLDRAAPFDGLADDEIAQLKRRAHRCASAGHWSNPASPGR